MGIKFCSRKQPSVPALEIRIHGVHGTSPASMLGVAEPKQVAGDGLTGVFRSEKPLPLRKLNQGTAVEAYSWGALTSNIKGVLGWVQRALWLLLLPAALINLAYWARLHVGLDTRTGRWGAATVRWAGLLITMLLVLALCVVSIDLVAWQCYRGGTKSCDVLPGALDFMMRLAPSQRIAIAALVPLAGVLVLWLLSRQSLARYESTEDTGRAHTSETGHLLQRSQFWTSKDRTQRLQRLHITGAVATVMTFVGVQVDHRQGVALGGWTAVSGFVLLAVFTLLALTQEGDVEGHLGDHGSKWAIMLDRVLVWLVLALAVVEGVWLCYGGVAEGSRRWVEETGWRGHNAWFLGVFLALTVLNIALFVAGRMGWAGASLTILVFLGLVALVLKLNHDAATKASRSQDFNSDELTSIGWGLALALTFMLFLLVWHVRRRGSHASSAWNGAGAAMLVGASAWIALLFVTAAVTASAEYLNGPEQSVADLASQYRTVDDAAPGLPNTTENLGDDLNLGKDVVLRDAVVVLFEGEAPMLGRGKIETAEANVDVTQPTRAQKVPDTVLKRTTLMLEEPSVELVASCLITRKPTRAQKDSGRGRPTAPACQPESRGYVTRARIDVPGKMITVSAPDQRVRLVVENPPQSPLVIPQVLIWTPIAQLLWAMLLLSVLGWCAIRLRRKVRPGIVSQVNSDGHVPVDAKAGAVRKRLTAAFAHRAERLLDLIGGVTVVLILMLLVISATGYSPWGLVERSGIGTLTDLAHPLATISLYAVLGLSAGLVMLGNYFRRSESARKAVGVIWDLTTFWPRAAHPLSPPCYAERVVPELTTRIRWALKDPGARVVVSGHSQGSLIAAATLMRLTDAELQRIRFITYGSQIRALVRSGLPPSLRS